MQLETGITNLIDPWAGSYYVESLTNDLANRAWSLIQEVEELGGMTKAIELGLPKMRIEEVAALKQARIDKGQDIIVGVNKFKTKEKSNLDIREIDNTSVREQQLIRLAKLKAERNQSEVDNALNAITHCAETKKETY